MILATGFLATGFAVVETCEELMFYSNMAASDLTPPGFLLSTIIFQEVITIRSNLICH